jgi:hypothetical protein
MRLQLAPVHLEQSSQHVYLEQSLKHIWQCKVGSEFLLIDVVPGFTQAFGPERNIPPKELMSTALLRTVM